MNWIQEFEQQLNKEVQKYKVILRHKCYTEPQTFEFCVVFKSKHYMSGFSITRLFMDSIKNKRIKNNIIKIEVSRVAKALKEKEKEYERANA